MRIAIVDDVKQEADKLLDICLQWTEENLLKCDFEVFQDGASFLESFHREKYDLIFLDIYMDGTNGIETARIIRKTDINCLIVFVTSSREHMWDAFPVHAFDYITKDSKPEKITNVLEEALHTLPEEIHYVELSVSRQKLRLIYSDLAYAQADDHHTLVTTRQGETLRCHMSFSSLLDILSHDICFLQCNRGILLNMDLVSCMKQDVFIMKDGKSFPIRQSDRKKTKEIFYQYQFKRLKSMKGRTDT